MKIRKLNQKKHAVRRHYQITRKRIAFYSVIDEWAFFGDHDSSTLPKTVISVNKGIAYQSLSDFLT